MPGLADVSYRQQSNASQRRAPGRLARPLAYVALPNGPIAIEVTYRMPGYERVRHGAGEPGLAVAA